MAKKSFDPSKYEYSKATGKLYVKGGSEVRDPKVIKKWRLATSSNGAATRFVSSTGATRNYANLKVPQKYQKFFGSSYSLTQKSGKVADLARPLAYRGGANPEYGWRRGMFWGVDDKGRPKIVLDSSSRRWGASLNQLNRKDLGKTKIGKGAVLNGSAQWVRQLQISIYQLGVNAERFRVIVGKRALQVFRESFKYQQFWSTGSQKWRPLSLYTMKKRAKRGTGTRILKEYGDLLASIKIDDKVAEGGVTATRIYTDTVKTNKDHHKKHTICYAGYHNDPRPGDTYGNRRTPYIRRQFMGHSDKIDTFAMSIMKRYLFDDVFLIKKV